MKTFKFDNFQELLGTTQLTVNTKLQRVLETENKQMIKLSQKQRKNLVEMLKMLLLLSAR